MPRKISSEQPIFAGERKLGKVKEEKKISFFPKQCLEKKKIYVDTELICGVFWMKGNKTIYL